MTGKKKDKKGDGEGKDAKPKIPKTFCQRWGTVMSIAVGVTLSASIVVPVFLLTDTPCTTTQTLKRGEQLFCVAPSWAGSGDLAFEPGKGLSGYIFEEEPAVDLTAPLIKDSLNGTTSISGYSFSCFTSWMLAGSSIYVSINASDKADVFYINDSALNSFKYGEEFVALVESNETKAVTFNHTFLPGASEDQLQRLSLLVRNGGSSSIDINYTISYEYSQLNFSGALASCHDEETCSFGGMHEGLIMIAVAHDNFTDDGTRLTMGWSYRNDMIVPGVVAVLACFVVVIASICTLIGVNRRKTRRQAFERQQISSEASGITPTPSITPTTDFS